MASYPAEASPSKIHQKAQASFPLWATPTQLRTLTPPAVPTPLMDAASSFAPRGPSQMRCPSAEEQETPRGKSHFSKHTPSAPAPLVGGARVVPEPHNKQPERIKSSRIIPVPPSPQPPSKELTAGDTATLIPPAIVASHRLLLTCLSSATNPRQAAPAANPLQDPSLTVPGPYKPHPLATDKGRREN